MIFNFLYKSKYNNKLKRKKRLLKIIGVGMSVYILFIVALYSKYVAEYITNYPIIDRCKIYLFALAGIDMIALLINYNKDSKKIKNTKQNKRKIKPQKHNKVPIYEKEQQMTAITTEEDIPVYESKEKQD